MGRFEKSRMNDEKERGGAMRRSIKSGGATRSEDRGREWTWSRVERGGGGGRYVNFVVLNVDFAVLNVFSMVTLR